MCLAIDSTADTMYDMSGSFVFLSGVGTQILIVSSSRTIDEVGRRVQEAGVAQARDVLRTDVRNVRTAGVDRFDLALVEVNTGGVEAAARKLDRKGQSDISETDDTRAGTSGGDLFAE